MRLSASERRELLQLREEIIAAAKHIHRLDAKYLRARRGWSRTRVDLQRHVAAIVATVSEDKAAAIFEKVDLMRQASK